MTAAVMAAASTAAAARSLHRFAFSWYPGETRLTSSSMAELASSAVNTSPMAKIRRSHSVTYNPVIQPAAITPAAAAKWIHALGCDRNNTTHPLNA